jgi:hypothetical protein
MKIKNPLDGSPLTLYNLSAPKLGRVDTVDRNPKGYTHAGNRAVPFLMTVGADLEVGLYT